jgi:uncharacterized protein YcfJ
MLFFAFAANAQTVNKVKRTSSPKQHVHNVFSKHKRYNGYKVKHKKNGHKRKTRVKYHHGKTEIKSSGYLNRKEELIAA